MAPAYEIAELRRLRTSASDSTIALEKAVKEDAVKEHVLRNSSSFASRNSLRQENIRTEAAPLNRLQNGRFGTVKCSPTPSIKRGKAERLLKEHGSPPGLRVTAGGKIVPSDLSPLCSPRFGFHQPGKQGFVNISPFEGPTIIPAAGISGRPMPANAAIPFSPFVGFTPDGQCVPLMPVPYGGLPNYANHEQFAQMPTQWNVGAGPPVTPVLPPTMVPGPVQGCAGNVAALSAGQQIQALEREQAKLNEEFRHVDQAGVIHQGVLNAVQRTALVARKVSLTNRLDEIRVSLKKLRESEDSKKTTTPPEKIQPAFGQPLPKPPRPSYPAPHMSMVNHPPGAFSNFPFFQMQNQFPMAPPPTERQTQMVDPSSTPFLAPNGVQSNFGNFPAPDQGMGNEPSAPPTASLERASAIEQSMGRSPVSTQISHEPRRSHAIAIKNPQEGTQQGGMHSQKTSLDPTSPSYRPMNLIQESARPSAFIARESEPSPCPQEALGKDYDWPNDSKDNTEAVTPSAPKDNELQHKPSLSSVSTADFFPNNPLEHSTRKIGSRGTSDSGLLAPPVTPNRASPGPITRHVDRRSSEAPASPAPNNFRVSSWSAACDPIPDRTENNMSPKARFSGAPCDKNRLDAVVSSHKASKAVSTIRAVESTDPEPKPRGFSDRYCEGYYAGLHRLPLAKDEHGEALEGYIAGLQHFADLQTTSSSSRPKATQEILGEFNDDSTLDDTCPNPTVELKENSMSPSTIQIKQEVELEHTRPPSAHFGAPLTRQFSGNQIQSSERNEKADEPYSAMTAIPTRVASVGQVVPSPGGSLGENRSRNISLPVNRRYQPASFNWTRGLPQHDGASDRAFLSGPEEARQDERLTALPNKPIPNQPEKVPTPPPKNIESPTKCSPWHPKSPKSSPPKPSRSPTKSRLDRLATHLGVKKSESTTDQDETTPGSPEMAPSTTPDRRKRREELKRFLSRPKAEQAHEMKPIGGERQHDA